MRACATLILLALSAGRASAAISGPYASDADTVHLFHLDEAAGATSAENKGSATDVLLAFNGAAAPASTTSLQPASSTILGAASYTGFGKAANIASAALGLGLDANDSGGFQPGISTSPDGIAHSGLTGLDGSFTVEALIQVDTITGSSREIVSTDSSQAARGFQFRVGSTGMLEFNFISGSGGAVAAAIPTAGLHGFVAGEWFHVALAFNGTTNSSTFYWTRLSVPAAEANPIGSSVGETTVAAVNGPLVIGNEGRGASGEALLGLIDEVRISKVARGAGDFLFFDDDGDEDGLSDAWETLHFGNLGEEANGDPDNDTYTNGAEYAAGTNPADPLSNPGDADSDGLPDAWELQHFGELAIPTGEGDPDGDFASNSLEQAGGSFPRDPLSWPDTDSDGMNDGWEWHYFSTLERDGIEDGDGDGFSDREEHDVNTHPLDPEWSPDHAKLAHRWSFNGNLVDSVAGQTAVLVDPDGNAATSPGTLGSSDVLLSGGTRSEASYIDLGTGLIGGRKTPVTIELWATQAATRNWARIFDIGSGTGEYLMMSWAQGTNSASDQVRWLDATSALKNNSAAPYILGVQYHIVLAIEPHCGAGGDTRMSWHVAPADDPVLGKTKGSFDTADSLLELQDTFAWLGRSMYAGDSTANARYDECRIWNGVLGERQREDLHLFGPDAADHQDSDVDGLPDAWEMARFQDLDEAAGTDPDGDGHSNSAEYEAGSDPVLTFSVPNDIDGDGLSDAAELRYFGNLSPTPTSDPDGDGESNAVELSNGSAPNNRASTATDTDSDGLTDAWENARFGTLSTNAGSDPDSDGWGNLQEQEAATDPANSASGPAGTSLKIVPLDDSDHATSEFGYAGSSAINTVSFVRSSLKTVGDQQFVTWYGRHQYDPAAEFNNTIWIGRRTLGSSEWEVFRHPTFTANAITDGHDVISYGIDGDGYMHVSWGMHGDAFHYSRSTAPVTGTTPIVLGPDSPMTGRENTVTYPQFLKLPDGDLLFLFREVASGNGDTFLNRYDTTTRTWDNVHRSGSTQLPFIKGTGWTPNYSAYPNMPQLGGDGDDLILTWCWRYEPVGSDSPSNENGYQTNNNFAFGRSSDAGLTWQRFGGAPYALPISRDGESGEPATAAEHIFTIPEGSSLINQASMCLDSAGNPVIGTWWAPLSANGNHQRQYMVCFRHDDGTWQSRAVSNRILDDPALKLDESHVRNLGRPVVVQDDAGRIIVAYRDNQGSNGLSVVHSLPKEQDPDRLVWIEFDLTTDNLGNYEPIIDNELWDRDRQLHFLYQASAGEGYSPPDNTAARFSILEWDAARYFGHSPQPSLAKAGNEYRISCPSQPSWSYRLWSSTNLSDWEPVQTLPGTGAPLEFTSPAGEEESRRYWRVEYREGGF